MDQWRLQTLNGRLVQTPAKGFWAVGDGTTPDPAIPNLPFEDRTPGALATPKPEIAFRGSNSVAYGSRTNTTVGAPTGVTTGDIEIAFFIIGNAVASFGSVAVPTPPAGFTEYDPDADGPLVLESAGYSFGSYVYWRRYAGDTDYTFTHSAEFTECFIVAYDNCLASGTPLGEQGAIGSGTDTTGIAPSFKTTADRSLVLFHEIDFTGTGGLTPPAGFTERYDLSVYVAELRFPTIQTTSSRQHTNNGGGGWKARMFELLAEEVSAGIAGTASITLDAATLSATGTLPIAGTASITLDAVTLSATGAVALTGALSATLGDVTLSAAGTLGSPISGEAAITLADATLVATGVVALAGVASITLDAATLAATGTLPIAGTASITLGAVALSATGTVALTGALSTTLGDVTLSATGTLGSSISGEAAITLADATLSATGAVALAGAASITLDDATLAATGTVALTASASITLGDATLAATGKVALAAALSTTLADATLSATGALALAGAASITLEDATLAATGVGAALNTGAASITLDDATLTATGTLTDGEAPPSTAIGGAWAWHRRALARRKAKAEPDPVVFVDIAGEILGEAIVRGRLEAVVYRDAPAAGYSVASAGPLETVVDIGGTVAARTEAPPATIIALQDRREWALTDDEIAALSLAA